MSTLAFVPVSHLKLSFGVFSIGAFLFSLWKSVSVCDLKRKKKVLFSKSRWNFTSFFKSYM